MTQTPNTALEKLKFLGRRGFREYRHSGRRFFDNLESYLSQARHLGKNVGELRLDARTADWESDHPLRKSVLEAAYTSGAVHRIKPNRVCDVGSDLVFIATLSSFVEVVVVDTRAIDLKKPGLTFKQSDARGLPFKDGECEFLTSLCVIEHIGLGRYGDSIDPLGDFKFLEELRRCLKPGGTLVLSMPVASRPMLVFNAHRMYSVEQIEELCSKFKISEEKFIYPKHGLLDRKEATALLSRNPGEYMIWIACLGKP